MHSRVMHLICIDSMNLAGQNLDAHGAVALFSQIGAFNQALQVALALRIDMTNVFQHLALRCVAFDRADLDTR